MVEPEVEVEGIHPEMTPNSPKSAEVAADKDSNDNDRNKDRNKVIQRPGVMARAVGKPILWYQKARAGSVSPCRHTPSCSTYALEAVETHGAAKGLYLGFRRVLRCNPWGTSGYDPVPERKAN